LNSEISGGYELISNIYAEWYRYNTYEFTEAILDSNRTDDIIKNYYRRLQHICKE
jgi:hypothetical protein